MSTHIVLSGSGARFATLVGALQYTADHAIPGLVTRVRSLVGSSGGAALCLFLALGYSLSFLETLSTRLLYHDLCTIDITRLLTGFGIDTGDKFERLLKALVKEKLGDPDATFADLMRNNPVDLRITGTNVTQRRLEVFAYDTTPDMPLWLALRISISLPLVFTAPVYKGDHYTDGGVLCFFPMDLVPADILRPEDRVLAVNLVYPDCKLTSLQDLPGFLTGIAASVLARINPDSKSLDCRYECMTVVTQMVSGFQMDLPQGMVCKLVEEGRRAAEAHFEHPEYIKRLVGRIFARVLAAHSHRGHVFSA